MQTILEFLYHIEIKTPKAAGAIRDALYGTTKIDFEARRPAELPVAYRLRHLRHDNEEVFRTDGVETLELFLEDFGELRRWFRGYSNRDTWDGAGDAVALRRWLGDGKPLRSEWVVSAERDYRRPKPETGLLVSDNREEAMAIARAKASRFVKVGGEVWRRRGFGILTVLSPGSVLDVGGRSGPKVVKIPRIEFDSFLPRDPEAWRVAEFAGRDLLFYPDEEIQARTRAADFGSRIASDWTVVEAPDLSCYPDLSALSMTSWTRLLERQVGSDDPTAVRIVPHDPPDEPAAPLPAEVAGAVEAFRSEVARGASSNELLSAFSAIAASFGASLAANALARRPDIAELLEIHERIVRRLRLRPDRKAAVALSRDDEEAVAALAEDGTSFRI